jgi:hypothetical protein
VTLANQVILAAVNQQIALERRLLVVGGNACLEAAMGGLNVAYPWSMPMMVGALLVIKVIENPFPPLVRQ